MDTYSYPLGTNLLFKIELYIQFKKFQTLKYLLGFILFYFIFQRTNQKARQMAQQVKIFAAKPEDPRTYTMEGEKMVLQVVPWSLH